MSLLRTFVTAAIALPLFLIVGWPHPWWATFLIAVVAVGAGHGAQALFDRCKKPGEAPPSDQE
jgi:hypothetical protein